MNFGLSPQIIAGLRVLMFLVGLIIGPGIPGFSQPANTELTAEAPIPPKPASPIQGVVGAGLMATALGLSAGKKD